MSAEGLSLAEQVLERFGPDSGLVILAPDDPEPTETAEPEAA